MSSNQDQTPRSEPATKWPRGERPRRHFRHHLARRRAMPRRHHDLRGEARSRRAARRDGRRHHRGRLPHREPGRFRERPGDRPAVEEFGDLRARPRASEGHRRLRRRDQAGAAGPHSHLHRHLAAPSQISDEHRRGRGAVARHRLGDPRPLLHRRCGMVGDGRNPHRGRFPLRLRRGRDQGRRHHRQHSRHGRLRHAGRVRRADPHHHRACAELGQGGVLHPLPQRSRARRRQFAGRSRGRGEAGGMRREWPRRARRQRGTGRDRHGNPHPRRRHAVLDRHRHHHVDPGLTAREPRHCIPRPVQQGDRRAECLRA